MRLQFKKLIIPLLFGLGLIASPLQEMTAVYAEEMSNDVTVHFFSSPTCAVCNEAEQFLTRLDEQNDFVSLIKYSINEIDNRTLFDEVVSTFEINNASVPLIAIGGKYYQGFNTAVSNFILRLVDRYHHESFVDIVEKIKDGQPILSSDFDLTSDYVYVLPIIGEVDVRSASIILLAIVLGFIDGVNPCALWVLIFLLGLVLSSNKRKRVWLIGGVFLFTSAAFYFLIMFAWLNIAVSIAQQTIFQIIIGSIALLAGGYNIYAYIKSVVNKDDGCEVVSEKRTNKLVERVKKIANTGFLPLALIMVVGLAIIVNTIELACSTGLPVIFTQVLAINGITGIMAVMYLLVYILFFLIIDLIIFTGAVLTLRVSPISARITKYGHLIGGLIMVGLGILMIFFPHIIMFAF
jgi:hypothetical protein